jgi:hypothetical protein
VASLYDDSGEALRRKLSGQKSKLTDEEEEEEEEEEDTGGVKPATVAYGDYEHAAVNTAMSRPASFGGPVLLSILSNYTIASIHTCLFWQFFQWHGNTYVRAGATETSAVP